MTQTGNLEAKFTGDLAVELVIFRAGKGFGNPLV